MYEYIILEDLKKVLKKLKSKSSVEFEEILLKIQGVIKSYDIDHYKNLKYPLNKYKRVHIANSKVLLFKVEGNFIIFSDYDHHDNIYRK